MQVTGILVFKKYFCFIYVRPQSLTGDMIPSSSVSIRPLGSNWIETAVSGQESTMRWKLREIGETAVDFFRKIIICQNMIVV